MVSRPAAALATLAAALGGCAHGRPRGPAAGLAGGSAVTLYRDGAVVEQRIALDVPAGGELRARVRVPAGLGAGDVAVLPQAGVEVIAVRQPGAAPIAPAPAAPAPAAGDPDLEELLGPRSLAPGPARARPAELELALRAPPGPIAIGLSYVTARLSWEAAYTLIATPARDQAELRGALAIRNTTGVALPAAAVRLVDASLADARAHAAEVLAARLGLARPRTAAEDARLAGGAAAPRDLGRLDLDAGETRVELVRPTAPRPLRSVLVYDPVGTRHDHAGRDPERDAYLGLRPPAGARVDESLEIERDPAAAAGLPAGPVRLLERRPGGALALLGEARLFDDAARVALRDTITLGAAAGVTGRRERREITGDDARRRLTEDFVITIENRRPYPVEVVLREHLYRSTNWTLAYVSVPVGPEAKEGPQQVAPRITVPARGRARLLYTVVYWW